MDQRHPLPTPPARLWSLDVLRGVCAAIVFLSHWHLWSDFAPRGALEHGVRRLGETLHEAFTILAWPTGGHHPAVLGFFVLSGFCIHYPFERRALAGEPPPAWRDYLRRRLFRIMPVYWTACALGLAFVAAETLRPSGHVLLALHALATPGDILVRFAGLAGIYPREIFAGNYILTTVTVEIIMYAAYPLFHGPATRGHWRALGLLFLALHAFAIALLPFFTAFWVFNSIFMLGIFWFAGAFAAHLYLVGRDRLSGGWLVVAWAAFLMLKALPHFTGLNLLKQAAWGLVCTLAILWIVRLEEHRPALGASRLMCALRKVGDLSYSLYAMHTPAIMLATWALLQLGQHDYFVQLASTLAAALTAVLATHYGIERKFYRPRSSSPPRMKPPPPIFPSPHASEL